MSLKVRTAHPILYQEYSRVLSFQRKAGAKYFNFTISVGVLVSRRKCDVSFYLMNHQIRISPDTVRIAIKSYNFKRIPSLTIYVCTRRDEMIFRMS